MSFEQAVQIATSQNPDLRAARNDLEAGTQRLRAAYSGYWPQVSASVGYVDESPPPPALTSRLNVTNLTATQNLFAGFQDEARVRQAGANLKILQQTLVLAKAQLSRDLKSAYAGLLYAQDNVDLTEGVLRQAEENLKLVELKYRGGRENIGAVLLMRATLAQRRLEVLQARQGLGSAQSELARVLGRPMGRLQAASAIPVQAPGVVSDFDDLAESAPAVRSAVAQEQAADAGVTLARAGLYPSLDLSGTTARRGDREDPANTSQWYRPHKKTDTVSLTLTIPLFNGGRDWYGVRAAVLARDVAGDKRQSVAQSAQVQLRQAYAAYVESAERVKVDQEFLDAAEARARIARTRYQNGFIGFDDWDRAEADLIERARSNLASRRDRVVAEAAWELAQGEGVIP